MTESEKVKKWFDSELSMRPEESLDSVECEEVKEICLKAIEEVQQYRALEEKLSGITVKEVVEHLYTKGRILTNKEAEEWEQMKEKATARKPVVIDVFSPKYSCKTYRCPSCNYKLI